LENVLLQYNETAAEHREVMMQALSSKIDWKTNITTEMVWCMHRVLMNDHKMLV
jgi:hypothetical protein